MPDEVVTVRVMRVTEDHRTEDVYDLEVDRTHNFVADGVVVHNSIYKWRGAAISNVLGFLERYPGARQIVLTDNYRSHQAILDAFADKRGGLLRSEARTLLAAAPTPHAAAKLSTAKLRALLTRAGLQRNIDPEAHRLREILQREYLHHPQLVEEAFGRQALALLHQLDAACASAEDLAAAAAEQFDRHPDAEIITSQPGLGSLTGARILAEIGDDRTRFTDARSLKAYAGSAPVTRASGKAITVLHRRVKNQRLAATGYIWAFAALTASPGARAHYDRRKATGDRHIAAQRNLFNRLIGILYHCLQTRQRYDETTAFAATAIPTAAVA